MEDKNKMKDFNVLESKTKKNKDVTLIVTADNITKDITKNLNKKPKKNELNTFFYEGMRLSSTVDFAINKTVLRCTRLIFSEVLKNKSSEFKIPKQLIFGKGNNKEQIEKNKEIAHGMRTLGFTDESIGYFGYNLFEYINYEPNKQGVEGAVSPKLFSYLQRSPKFSMYLNAILDKNHKFIFTLANNYKMNAKPLSLDKNNFIEYKMETFLKNSEELDTFKNYKNKGVYIDRFISKISEIFYKENFGLTLKDITLNGQSLLEENSDEEIFERIKEGENIKDNPLILFNGGYKDFLNAKIVYRYEVDIETTLKLARHRFDNKKKK